MTAMGLVISGKCDVLGKASIAFRIERVIKDEQINEIMPFYVCFVFG